MKDNDFAALADEALSSLEWTDQQRMNALRLMRQPERMPMKKKLALCLVSTVLMLAGLLTAFAVGTRFADLTDFFSASDNRFITEHLAVPVDASAIVTPANQRHTSQWADMAITQMYLSEGKLFIVAHLTPKAQNTVLYADSAEKAFVDGEALRYFELYRREELTIIKSLGLSLDWDDLAGAHTPDGELNITQLALPDEEGGGLTLLTVCEVPEELPALRYGGCTLQAEFVLQNVRTGEHERNVIFADVPPMEMVSIEAAE